ncbi:helix-turn-helix domain-containing protein [Alkalicoccobacillus porphyridii]|uniref:Helix-turn-helix domain-containing protein n=1 Tax=Alkalicoccobacillus porphyridii TaxID=2597270 RepID=A0A554A044_9BACI|nr:helix-turn-helix domain-containing protein [Alkalicoccobacillus porphyridii]TSB47060.1 helix-turn-helix domain-containing protein [Alkalicoccobacillus porphyridii]
MFRRRTLNVYRRFLISYVIILLIPIMTGFFTYHAAIKEAENYAIRTSIQSLNQSKSLLEQRLSEVERFARHIAINDDLQRILLLSSDESTRQISLLSSFSSAVTPFASTNDFIEDYYIRINKSNLIITPGSVYFRPQQFFAGTDYSEAYLSKLVETENRTHSFISPTEDMDSIGLTFVQSIPLDSAYASLGTVVVPIKQNDINNIVKSMPNELDAWTFIRDGENKVISATNITKDRITEIAINSNEQDVEYLKDGTLVVTMRSDKNDLIYTAGIPKSTIAAQAKPIKDITLIVTSVTLLVGLCISLQFSRRNSRPITSIVKRLNEYMGAEAKSKNEYDSLMDHVSHLLKSHTELRQTLSNQMPVLKDLFIKQLLHGSITAEQAVESYNNSYGEKFSNHHVGNVFVAEIASKKENLPTKEYHERLMEFDLYVEEKMGELYPFLHKTISQRKLIYLLLIDKIEHQHSPQKAEILFKELNDKVEGRQTLDIHVGIGQSYERLSDINRSYHEALVALQYGQDLADFGVFLFRRIVHSSTIYFYPYDWELSLLKNIKDGNAEASISMIDTLFNKNKYEKSLSPKMLEHFLVALKGTVMRAIDATRQEGQIKQLYEKLLLTQINTNKSEELKQMIISLIYLFCDWKDKKQAVQDHVLIQKVKECINVHYTDAGLTSNLIASKIGDEEKRMISLFKYETGERLNEYIERVRIKKAEDLLSQGVLTIEEIAEQVGYNSAHSFRRVFKRLHAITPVQYRENLHSSKA